MARQLKAGMWVKSPSGKIGLLFGNNITGKMEFHQVNAEDGSTVLVVPIEATPEAGGYVQAQFGEIPVCRRMPEEVARSLEYLPPLQ